jgi:hypothetical protein
VEVSTAAVLGSVGGFGLLSGLGCDDFWGSAFFLTQWAFTM